MFLMKTMFQLVENPSQKYVMAVRRFMWLLIRSYFDGKNAFYDIPVDLLERSEQVRVEKSYNQIAQDAQTIMDDIQRATGITQEEDVVITKVVTRV